VGCGEAGLGVGGGGATVDFSGGGAGVVGEILPFSILSGSIDRAGRPKSNKKKKTRNK